jgi:hypothetical protein
MKNEWLFIADFSCVMLGSRSGAAAEFFVPLARVSRQWIGHGLGLFGRESELGGQHGEMAKDCPI